MQDLRYDLAPGAPFYWLADTQEALKMLGERKLGKREKAARTLLLAYLHKIRGNTLSRTWEKGLATRERVSDKMDLLAKDTTRFMAALNLVTHPQTPLKAITMTVRKYKNNVEELH